MVLKFKGWWEEREKKDDPKPWETFIVCLHGQVAGDFAAGKEMEKVLRASGYELELKLIKVKK